MMRPRIVHRWPFALGLTLIVVGIFLRRLVEMSLSSDGRIEAPALLTIIFSSQIVVILIGVFLLVRQPAIHAPSRTDVLLPVVSIVMTFVILELGARGWLAYLASSAQRDQYLLYTEIDPANFAWTPHHYLGYYPTPNYRKGKTHHNSLGYRANEISLVKPDGVYRIVALGGSSTYDVRIEDNNEVFTAQLERLLRDQFGNRKIEVINAGVPGYNSWEMLGNLEFRVLDLDPDLVIICEGTNDVHARLVVPGAYLGDNSGRRHWWKPPQVAPWERSVLLRIISRMSNFTRQVSVDDFASSPTYLSWPYENRLSERGFDPREVLAQNPPIYFRRNLENMIAVARAQDVEVLLATWAYSPYLHDYASLDYYEDGFQENNGVVKSVARSQHAVLFDFATVMPQDAIYWADGRHVNEAGALEKARLFADFIEAQGLLE